MANQREGRRRRVLREETGASRATKHSRSRTRSRPAKTKAFADEALVELQPRITDLIPLRLGGLLIVLLLGVVSVAAVQALFLFRVNRLANVDYQIVSSLNLYGPGTVLNWCSSVYLLLAGGAALLVFNTRRHKVDDYFGRYSLWIWISGFCFVGSLDVATGLHRVLQFLLTRGTGTSLWGDGSIWWIATIGLCAFVLGLRALMDMYSWCRAGALFIAFAACGYAFTASIYVGVYRPNLGQHNATLHSSVLLLSHYFVLYSFLLYARSIHLMAQGIARPGRRKRNASASNWWMRQRERFQQARAERATTRQLRKEEKLAKAASRRTAKEDARQQAEADKVEKQELQRRQKKLHEQQRQQQKEQQKAQLEEQRQRQKMEKEQQRQQKKQKTKRKPAAPRISADAPAPKTKVTQQRVVNQPSVAQRPVQGRSKIVAEQSVAGDTDRMDASELEMELLTNPNLSRAERRKLRKQLKDAQALHSRAA